MVYGVVLAASNYYLFPGRAESVPNVLVLHGGPAGAPYGGGGAQLNLDDLSSYFPCFCMKRAAVWSRRGVCCGQRVHPASS